MTKIELIYIDFILLSQWFYPQITQIFTDYYCFTRGGPQAPKGVVYYFRLLNLKTHQKNIYYLAYHSLSPFRGLGQEKYR